MKSTTHSTGRARRFINWAGLVVSALFAAVWIGSAWYAGGYVTKNRDFAISVSHGCIGSAWGHIPDTPSGWWHQTTSSVGRGFSFRWWFSTVEAKKTFPFILNIPIWPLILAAVTPFAITWRREYRIRRGLKSNMCPHCKFDLSGLALESVCPECGEARGA